MSDACATPRIWRAPSNGKTGLRDVEGLYLPLRVADGQCTGKSGAIYKCRLAANIRSRLGCSHDVQNHDL